RLMRPLVPPISPPLPPPVDGAGQPTVLVGAGAPPLIIPVPLHRWRLWSRGFNQSVEVGRHLSRDTGLPMRVDVLVRARNTPRLRGLGRVARARVVRGAFAVPPAARPIIAGRTIYLLDDVFTSGATAGACARTLLRAGAARVEVWAFARVVDDPAITRTPAGN
ncbi:MAG: ComF family protein, partial [Sphingopyxis sp.]